MRLKYEPASVPQHICHLASRVHLAIELQEVDGRERPALPHRLALRILRRAPAGVRRMIILIYLERFSAVHAAAKLQWGRNFRLPTHAC